MSRVRLSWFFAVAIVLMAWASPMSQAAAQVRLTGDAVSVCVLPAKPGMTPAALLAPDIRFDCATEQTRFGPGDFWLRSAPVSRTGSLHVRIAVLWQTKVTVYAVYADGAIVAHALDDHAATRRVALGAILDQPLAERPAPLVRLLWHVEGSANMRGILNRPSIATSAEAIESNLFMAAAYGGFAGLCIALLCYNFALWVALRYRFQLVYCGMVMALLLYAFSSSGALAWAWPTIANTGRLRLNYLTLGLSIIGALAFARYFFEEHVFAGTLNRLVTAAGAVMLTAALGFTLFAPDQTGLLDRAYSCAFAAQIVVIAAVLWRAWATRSNYLWLFALAWAAPIVLAGLRVANAFRLVAPSFWLDNSTLIAMTAEALLSSIAIAYRMRLLTLERDEARKREIAAQLLADTDPLTGLLNRRAFLHQAIGRDGEQVLMIADLDHFKRVNETIGHDGGDEVLRVFARTLRQSLPPEALVARIGGEEFAIVAPIEHAIEPGEILARLRAGRMPYDVTVTASIGTCTGPLLRETDWKALYACADRALFEAKSAGRDRARQHALRDRLAA